MGDMSKIEWTDATWNPVTGCTPASPGCDHCYAARMVKRFPHLHGVGQTKALSPNFSQLQFHPDRLDQPLRWKKPRRIFVCSMGDLFHEHVAHGWIVSVFSHIEASPQHTFMVLTKRPENMLRHFRGGLSEKFPVLKNLWLGVTAENQVRADQRIPILLQTPAAKRFVSVEPMLDPVDLTRGPKNDFGISGDMLRYPSMSGPSRSFGTRLDWVIVGGESGPGARPMHPDWPRSLRDQCQAAGVPFFFKQWGEWGQFYDRDKDDPDWQNCPKCPPPNERYVNIVGGHGFHGDRVVAMRRIGKKAAGYLLDGKEHKEFPEVSR